MTAELVPLPRRFHEAKISDDTAMALTAISPTVMDLRSRLIGESWQVRGRSPGLVEGVHPDPAVGAMGSPCRGTREIDLVGHQSGNATGWTENRSVRSKAEKCLPA